MTERIPRRYFNQQLAIAAVSLAGRRVWSAANSKIKVGQIGTAHAHAPGKMQTLRKLSDVYEVVGIVEPDETLRKLAQDMDEYRSVPWLSEEELFNTPGLQVVAVETAVRDLVPTALRCIQAGYHVHLDKPAGESLEAFAQLLNTAREANRHIQMGYMMRYNPGFQFCAQAVREGWLGDIFEIHGVISKKVGSDKRWELSAYRGGTMFELGCHLIDFLISLLGTPERVTAHNRQTHPERDPLIDNQLAVFDYPKATATIRSSLIEPYGFERRQFVVCGEEGTIEIRPLEPPTTLLALTQPRGPFHKGYQSVELPPQEGRYDSDFLDLAQIVRGEKEPDYTPDHDLAVHRAVLAAAGYSIGD